MDEYANKFNKGTARSRNKDICKLNSRVHYLKRRINEVEDVNVRTLFYSIKRYPTYFILKQGIIGFSSELH